MKRLLALLLVLLLTGCAKPQPPQYDRPVIALVDTGISTAAIDSADLLPGQNYVSPTADTEDRINHGTAVASTILGCESAAVEGLAAGCCYVVPLVVADADHASVTPEILAKAIRDAVDVYGADIINVSLGIKKDDKALRKAVEYAEQQDVLVVAAAGNDGGEALFYPAAYETVLAVGSHDRNHRVSDFSQKNDTVDLLAPGEDVWFASRSGETYGTRGTSYATGFVSAAAALVWQSDRSLTAREVAQTLLASAQTANGWRILDPAAVLAALPKHTDPDSGR